MDHPVQLVHIPGRSTTVDVYKYICTDGTTYDHDASWYEENCTGTTDAGGMITCGGIDPGQLPSSLSRTASGATSPRTSSVTTATGWT
jgi:hypothetical protein